MYGDLKKTKGKYTRALRMFQGKPRGLKRRKYIDRLIDRGRYFIYYYKALGNTKRDDGATVSNELVGMIPVHCTGGKSAHPNLKMALNFIREKADIPETHKIVLTNIQELSHKEYKDAIKSEGV